VNYQKWGRSFIDSLLRHVGTSLTIWIGTEIKYQEINYHDLVLFIFCGAVIPTIAEFLKQGLPPPDEKVTTVMTETTVTESKPQPKVE
jgi:hypothetical protein